MYLRDLQVGKIISVRNMLIWAFYFVEYIYSSAYLILYEQYLR